MLRALALSSPRAEEQTHLSKALEIILWTAMASSLLLVLSGLLFEPEYTARWLRVFLIIQVLSLPTFILNRRGFTTLASMFLVGWLWILVTGMVVTGGGLAAPASFVYVIIVFVAGFLLGPRAGIVAALLCIFTAFALVVIEITGHLPSSSLPYNPITRWISFTLFITIMMSLQYLAARTIRDALFQTRRELQDRKRAEEALEANEALLRQFIKHAPAAIAMFDTKVCYLQTSDRWLTVYHQEGQNLIGKSHYEVVPDLPDRWKTVHARALAGAVERCGEDSIVRADGTTEWLQWEVMPWRKGGGEIGGFILFTQDVTERKQGEERINLLQTITMDVATANDIPSALEVVLRHVCEKTGWALGQAWVPRQDGKALERCATWSAGATNLGSFKAASKDITFLPSTGLPGRVWASRQPAWIRDVTLDTNFPRAEVAKTSGLKAALGVPILSNEGVIAVLEFFLREPRDQDERLVKLITAVAEQIGLVVERKLAEEALRWSEEQLRLLLDSTAEGVFGVNLQGLCSFCNASSLRFLGYDNPAELLGKDMHALIAYNRADGTPYPKEDCPVVQSLCNAVRVFRDDEVFWKKDCISFPVAYWSYPMFRESKHIGAVVTFLDITERKRAEDQLRRASERLQLATRAASIGIWDWDVVKNELVWDDAMYRLYGIRKEDFSGAFDAWTKSLAPEDCERANAEVRAALAGEREFASEFRTVWPDGSIHHIQAASQTFRDGAGRPVRMVGVNYDITALKEAEAALRQSEHRFELASRATNDVIFDWDLKSGFLWWGESDDQRIFGYRPQAVRNDIDWWKERVHPEDRAATVDYLNATIEGEQQKWEAEYRFRRANGSYADIYERGFIVRDKDGEPLRMVGSMMDITERRRAEEELRASSRQLRALSESLRSAKEEEGIRIARELHDELGSALTTLKWSLLRLDKVKSSTTERVGKAAEKITEMVGLVDSTINTVRRISSELRPGVVDDLGLVSAIEWHAQQFQDNTGVVCSFESDAEDVDLNREQATTIFRIFQEAMTNIMRHARATKANILIEEEEGGFVLEIKDNGRGITETEKLGTRSLGLLGMRERAHSLGGTLDISGAAGKGTILTVRFPIQTTSAFKPLAERIEAARAAMSSLSRTQKS